MRAAVGFKKLARCTGNVVGWVSKTQKITALVRSNWTWKVESFSALTPS